MDPGQFAGKAEDLRRNGQTVMFVAVDGALASLIGVADPIKETTAKAIQELRADGLRIVMLTGDNRTTAEAVARKLGIDEIEAEVLPQEKGEIIRKHKAEGRIVAMAGDGVNDAPALAEADVGIAMGTGTDVAIQSAGVTLVKGDLSGIARAAFEPQRDAQHPAESVPRLRLQLARRACSGGRALPDLRPVAQPHYRRRGDEPELALRGGQCAALASSEDLVGRSKAMMDGMGWMMGGMALVWILVLVVLVLAIVALVKYLRK